MEVGGKSGGEGLRLVLGVEAGDRRAQRWLSGWSSAQLTRVFVQTVPIHPPVPILQPRF